MSQSREPETVLITGASSGIGKALSLNYAAAGRRLFLQGRDRSRLDA
ncbi:MAG: SDR family NAD(P)-dependent oxidoreductase, partial [Geminicoccaceae bacterium]